MKLPKIERSQLEPGRMYLMDDSCGGFHIAWRWDDDHRYVKTKDVLQWFIDGNNDYKFYGPIEL